ncbi:MAG: hypothetical protein Q3983_04465 [Capnocytophaga sp.]|nr:hypothetical protein [Capnocytophaga sp.]
MNLDTITEDTIIYQGESHWTPLQIKNTEFKNYCKDWYRAGLKAQEHFKTQAKEEGLILEELMQDQVSFQQYLISDKYIDIKRGDFLVRNYGNLEVDVKCRSFRYLSNRELSFRFSCNDAEKHLNMQEYTQTPIIIAVYQRDGDKFIPKIPYFISIDRIKELSSTLEKVFVENVGNCYEIPLRLTIQSFDYITDFDRYDIRKVYSIDKMRDTYPNTGKKWTTEEDDKLEVLYCEKTKIVEICNILERSKTAILLRIDKLELREKYDI